jgi:hypothetical protein
MKAQTNDIMLHALTTLWPQNEPTPYLKAFKPFEWECTTGGDPCGYAATQEEALYRYALICQKYDDKFTPVINFLADFVDHPIIDEKPIGPFVEMDEIVNNFFQP